MVTISGLALGLALAYLAAKRAAAVVRRMKTDQKVKSRQERARANIKRFEDKYPELTSEQASISSLDLPELRQRLQKGELTAVQALEAFTAAAVAANKTSNAVTEFLEDALSRARGLDSLPQDQRGPLHGIPISLKVKNAPNWRKF